MISLITRYIFFIQLILNSFTTFSYSLKTYQVQCINESTYLVTSLPEFENVNRKRLSHNAITKLFSLNDAKRSTNHHSSTRSSVTVGEERRKIQAKTISPEFIKKVRENYFRTFHTTVGKATHSLLPDKLNRYQIDISTSSTDLTAKINSNLVIARKIASVLINKYKMDMKKRAIFLERVKRRKRNVKQQNRRRRHELLVSDRL